MKNLKTYENFNPYDDEPLTRSEEIFGKQTRLEKQFSKIVVDGLIGDLSRYWSTFNALTIEILRQIDEDDVLYKEFQNSIVEGNDPSEAINLICGKLEVSKEMQRLLDKINSF